MITKNNHQQKRKSKQLEYAITARNYIMHCFKMCHYGQMARENRNETPSELYLSLKESSIFPYEYRNKNIYKCTAPHPYHPQKNDVQVSNAQSEHRMHH